MIKFFNYSGTKIKYTDIINSYINKSNKKIYVEPFVGSGAVFFNLQKTFDQYVLNDIDANILKMYKTFKEIDYSYYIEQTTLITNEFGEFKSHKSHKNTDDAKRNYYAFRNWFNEKHYNTNSIIEGLYLHMLSNMCINSFLRFGPNGMNQSFGNRYSILTKDAFNEINKRLSNTILLNESYNVILNNNEYKNGCFFLDPPYYSQASSYTGFTEDDLINFINLINISNVEYVYTDILNNINDIIPTRTFLREIKSTSPNSPGVKTNNMEYIFSNIR